MLWRCVCRLFRSAFGLRFALLCSTGGSDPKFLISLIFGWCNGRRPRNVLRKFETIWTSGSLVIAVCSLKLKTDFSNLQASFGLPRRKCTGKYNFQVSKLYVIFMAWLYAESETSSAMHSATSDYGYKTFLNSHENAESDSKMENFNTALARAE